MMKLNRILLISACLLLNSVAWSTKTVPTINMVGVDIPHQHGQRTLMLKHRLASFFKWLDEIGTKSKKATLTDFKYYFDTEIVYSVNDTLLANTVEDVYKRTKILLHGLKSMHLTYNKEDIILVGDSGAMHYDVNITDNKGTTYQDAVNVMFRVKENKIILWKEIAAHKP